MKKSIESFIIGMGSVMNIAGNYHDIPRYRSKNKYKDKYKDIDKEVDKDIDRYIDKYIDKYRSKYRNKNIKVMSDAEAFEHDMKALQSDWGTIGQDFKKVLQDNPPSSFTK